MKRILSTLLALLVVLSNFVFGSMPVYAERSENPYIQTIGYPSVTNESSPIIFRDTATGQPAYCIDYNRHVPSPDSMAGELNPETVFDPSTYRGLQALLLAGYPFETGGLTNNEAQGCTQLAVWCWTYETMGYGIDASRLTPISGKENVYDFFMGLMTAARNQSMPNISVGADPVSMTKDGDRLIGQTTVHFNNLSGNYSLDESKLPAGITISGYTGGDGDVLTFTAPLSFAGQHITLENILLGHDTRSTLNLFWYENKNPDQQRMVLPTMDQEAVAVSGNIAMDFQGIGALKLTKLDADTNKPLSGAVFGVYDSQTNEKICELTTDENGEASVALVYGQYYVVELTAPAGYRLDDKQYPVEMNAEQAEVALSIADVPMSGALKVTKTDENGGRLSGAVFGVYRGDNNEKVAELTTDENGTASTDLPIGDYYLLELSAPAGYQKSDDKINFGIADGETTELTITNSPIPEEPKTGYLQITKVEQGKSLHLSGAVFGVYDTSNDEKIAELTTDTDGRAFMELPIGDFYILELSAPVGYQLVADKTSFAIKATETTALTVENPKLPEEPKYGQAKIIKRAEGTGETLPGAVFGVYHSSDNEKVVELTTGADGTTSSSALVVGDYYLQELKAPEGFQLNVEKINFTVKDGETAVITISDKAIEPEAPKTGQARVIKKDEATGMMLSGAVFGVYNASDNRKVIELTTDSTGTTTSAALVVGDYYLQEITAPAGYQRNTEKISFTISEGEVKELIITNKSIEPAPPNPGKILIIKKADGSGEKLKDAVFGVYDTATDKKVAELITDSYGEAFVELAVGDYYLRELKAPTGFKLNTDRIPGRVKAGETKEITITNKAEKQPTPTPSPTPKPTPTPTPTAKAGKLVITKIADGIGEKLKDAVFGVYDTVTDKKVAELTTDPYGEASVSLAAGDYYLRELKAPAGFKLNTDRIPVRLKSAETKEITIINKAEPVPTPSPTPTVTPTPTPTPIPTLTPVLPPKTGTLQIIKSAEITGQRLSGAVFGVYKAVTNEKIAELTTNNDGTASLALPEGDFYLKELKAPAGFILETAKIPFCVETGNTVKVEVTNMLAVSDKPQKPPVTDMPVITIPKTGEAFPYGSYALSIFFLCVAAVCGAMLYKNKIRRPVMRTAAADVSLAMAQPIQPVQSTQPVVKTTPTSQHSHENGSNHGGCKKKHKKHKKNKR